MRQALQAIDDAARLLVAARGHDLGSFIEEETGWAGECWRCERWVRVDNVSNLSAGDFPDVPISGALVRQNCSGQRLG